MTASPGLSYTNDVLGNRTQKGSGGGATSYGWDDLNRMTSLGGSGTSNTYQYRADGMRVWKDKHQGSTVHNAVRYRYDGQMGTEDVELTSTNGGNSYSISAITRHGIGARGVDVMSRTTSSGNTLTYPLYDAHGNAVGLLARNGTSFTISDERSYDSWGSIRSGGTSDNKSRYVASIGHKQDDESELIYMRARYCEPSSGRFVGEDLAKDGANWFVYCSNNPIGEIDPTGCISNAEDRVATMNLLIKALEKRGVPIPAKIKCILNIVGTMLGYGVACQVMVIVVQALWTATLGFAAAAGGTAAGSGYGIAAGVTLLLGATYAAIIGLALLAIDAHEFAFDVGQNIDRVLSGDYGMD